MKLPAVLLKHDEYHRQLFLLADFGNQLFYEIACCCSSKAPGTYTVSFGFPSMSKGPAEFGKVVGYGTEDIAILECREKFFCGLVFLTTKVSLLQREVYTGQTSGLHSYQGLIQLCFLLLSGSSNPFSCTYVFCGYVMYNACIIQFVFDQNNVYFKNF